MAGLIRRLLGVTWLRYLGASVLALGADLAIFFSMVAGGVAPVAASVAGYCVGIAVHWLVSSRLVFADTVATGRARTGQKSLFLVSALAGLTVTAGIVAAGGWVGLSPMVSKMLAVGVGFQLTYWLRKSVVFTRGQEFFR